MIGGVGRGRGIGVRDLYWIKGGGKQMRVGDRVCNTLTGTDYEPLLPAKTPASNVREARALQVS